MLALLTTTISATVLFCQLCAGARLEVRLGGFIIPVIALRETVTIAIKTIVSQGTWQKRQSVNLTTLSVKFITLAAGGRVAAGLQTRYQTVGGRSGWHELTILRPHYDDAGIYIFGTERPTTVTRIYLNIVLHGFMGHCAGLLDSLVELLQDLLLH
ncbi:hypothetical protein LSAT2_003157 [Lamellibrachia satsuma]|nr:hypothetical protein LSAT2_003157 [Lamellibrachia satsuma]